MWEFMRDCQGASVLERVFGDELQHRLEKEGYVRLTPRLRLGYFPMNLHMSSHSIFEQSFLWFQTLRRPGCRPPVAVLQPVAGRAEWSCMYVSKACSHPRWPYPASFPPRLPYHLAHCWTSRQPTAPRQVRFMFWSQQGAPRCRRGHNVLQI